MSFLSLGTGVSTQTWQTRRSLQEEVKVEEEDVKKRRRGAQTGQEQTGSGLSPGVRVVPSVQRVLEILVHPETETETETGQHHVLQSPHSQDRKKDKGSADHWSWESPQTFAP